MRTSSNSEHKVYAFDSTTFDLCFCVFEWAHFQRAKGVIKGHTLFDLEAFIVVLAKSRLQYQQVKRKRRMPKNVISDSIIRLTVYKSRHNYLEELRRVESYDDEQDRRPCRCVSDKCAKP